MIFLSQQKQAFTLTEIIVWISIISIITLWVTQVDFNRLSQRQKISIESTKIINTIEAIRDFALSGKWVGNPLVTPSSWTLDISTNGSGTLLASYNTGSIVAFPQYDWKSDTKIYIKSIVCEKLNGVNAPLSGTGTLTFTGENISLTGCPDIYYKKLILELESPPFSEKIEINSINGVVNRK